MGGMVDGGWVVMGSGGFLGLRLAISGRNKVTCNAQSVVPSDGAHARMQDAAARRQEARSKPRNGECVQIGADTGRQKPGKLRLFSGQSNEGSNQKIQKSDARTLGRSGQRRNLVLIKSKCCC